jgi:uncharacterized protein (DUF488 family)
MSGELQVWTVGHSSRKLEEMAEALRAYRISLLVDIRTIPRSRHNPQFNGDTFSRYLQGLGVKYLHMKELGGLRKPRRDSMNAAWRNMSFRGFADYMQTREFEEALARLMELLKGDKVAIMCCEGTFILEYKDTFLNLRKAKMNLSATLLEAWDLNV